jgi:hypothetical protein
VTLTVTAQFPAGGIVAPESVRELPPSLADGVPPGQVVTGEAGIALIRPAGYASVKPAPVIETGLALNSETVITDVVPATMGLGANALTAVGAALPTVRSAVAGSVLAPPLVEVTSPGLIVLV